jgi:hypothetical protein
LLDWNGVYFTSLHAGKCLRRWQNFQLESTKPLAQEGAGG